MTAASVGGRLCNSSSSGGGRVCVPYRDLPRRRTVAGGPTDHGGRHELDNASDRGRNVPQGHREGLWGPAEADAGRSRTP